MNFMRNFIQFHTYTSWSTGVGGPLIRDRIMSPIEKQSNKIEENVIFPIPNYKK